MSRERTTIQVSVELWQWLNARKQPGQSFDDVLRRELDVSPESEDGGGARRSRGSEARSDGVEVPSDDAERVWYRCGYCGTVFEVPGALAAHVEENHSEATIHEGLGADHDVIVGDDADDGYPCTDCDVTFDDWDAFAAHNEEEHGRENAD